MKGSLFPVVFAFLILLGAGGMAAWIYYEKERQYHKVEIPASWLESADTSRFSVQPISLTRTSSDDSLLLFFPHQENRSQIYLYDQENYNRLLFGDHHGMPTFLPDMEGMKALYGRPVINLSGFPEGKYYVHVTACSFGGFLQLSISDSAAK